MAYEVYLDRDNEISLILESGGTAADLTAVNKIELIIGGRTISCTGGTSGAITWGSTYDAGEVRLHLGSVSSLLTTGVYRVPIIVYDPVHPGGIYWGRIQLDVRNSGGG